MAQSDMPTMRSRRLGGELRQLRLNAGLKVQDAAEALECGQPKISQIENGKRGIRPLDLTTLLNLYGLEDERQRASLKRLAKEIHKVDWWSGQGPFLHDVLKDYLMLEADSQAVRTFEPMVIPGLLQTKAYMQQQFSVVTPAEQIGPLVATRIKRKELLDNKLGFKLRAVIDAPALHRIGGAEEVVLGQLEHLLDAGSWSNVNVQVLPVDAALPMEQYAPFTVFSLEAEPPVEVVWLEHLTGGTLLEQRHDVQAYAGAWDDLTAAALSPAESRQHIRELIEERRT
ncbi:helix-turn-helix domain-containing protein [Streptomyces sp. NPDC057718]|uniref:helix-turn-helix domain-containing protein n=1 Tax=Streptomyces sp. NPDC057718 TaxID=3346225 RepID=UPI003679A9D4